MSPELLHRRRPPAMVGYPARFHVVLAVAGVLLLASGALLLPAAMDRRFAWQWTWELPSGWRVTGAALHAACGWFALLLVGALLAIHVRIGWRRRRLLPSGLSLLASLLLLALSALGINYFGDEDWSLWAGRLHVVAAVGVAAIAAWHVLRGRHAHRLRVRPR